MVEAWGTGRKDYSSEIVRAVIPTAKGEQSHYWGVVCKLVDAWSNTTFLLERGFSPTHEWVPEGTKFILTRVEVTASKDSLTLFKILKERRSEPGEYSAVGAKYGYQQIVIESQRSHYWHENERPVYTIYNYNKKEPVEYYINIYGIIERVD